MQKYIALVLSGIVSSAFAQSPLPPFEDVDTNRDGAISEQEAEAVEGLNFSEADTNQDGSLSREEYAAS